MVVDDGSSDDTAQAVVEASARTRKAGVPVHLFPHGHNLGYGAALQTGFLHARGDLLAFIDADSTYPPEELPKLCRACLAPGVDMVVGSRMSGGPSQMPAVRRLGNLLFAQTASRLAGQPISDCCSGMRVLRASAWKQLEPLPTGLEFTPAMTMRALHRRLNVQEVAIPYYERVGRSKLKAMRDGLRFLRAIVGETRAQCPQRLRRVTWLGLAAPGLNLAATLAGVAWWQRGPWQARLLLALAGVLAALMLARWGLSMRPGQQPATLAARPALHLVRMVRGEKERVS